MSESERKPRKSSRRTLVSIVYEDQSIRLRTDGEIEINGKTSNDLGEIQKQIRVLAKLQDKALQV